jgi:hypothetical protein
MKEKSLKLLVVGRRSVALWFGVFVLLSVLRLPLSTFAQGTAFTYQGRLNDGSAPADGNYDMRFYLRNAAVAGSPVGTTNTVAPVAASNGLFTVTLDFGSGIFTGSPLWLEIGVRTNGSVAAFTTLSPRQALTPSPYALFSPQAGGVTNGAITSAMLANGVVTSAKLADGAVTSQQLADAIALGSASVNGQLDIYHTTGGGPAISLLGAANQLSIYGESDSLEKVRLVDASGLGELLLYNNFGSAQGVALLANFFNGGGYLSLNGTNGQNRAVLDGGSAGGAMRLNDASTANTVSLNSTGNSWLTGGNLGLGTTTPIRALHIKAGQALARLETTAAAFGSVLELQNSGSASFLGAINFMDVLGNVPVQLGGLTNGDMNFRAGNTDRARLTATSQLKVFTTTGQNGVVLDANGQAVSVYDGIGHEEARLDGNPWGELQLNNSGAGHQVAVDLSANGIQGGYLSLNNSSGAPRAYIAGLNTGAYMSLTRGDGTTTISLLADDGTGSGLITTSVLQITGGADLSEQFDVRETLGPESSRPPEQDDPESTTTVQPGMVVCIDPDNPGQLIVSTKAYDRTVAGIVSGAGGVNPGMLMGHHGTVADGKHPVALTGRVYCLADASSGPIYPGDLLTTSATPGHAMKVADSTKSQGAILGKAMSQLDRDRGLVLVLVSLQ